MRIKNEKNKFVYKNYLKIYNIINKLKFQFLINFIYVFILINLTINRLLMYQTISIID